MACDCSARTASELIADRHRGSTRPAALRCRMRAGSRWSRSRAPSAPRRSTGPASRHVGFSTVISTGVGDDIGFGEVLDFLARDGATDGIMLYMEGVERCAPVHERAARGGAREAGRGDEGGALARRRAAAWPSTRDRSSAATTCSTRRCVGRACCASATSASCSAPPARSVPASACAGGGSASSRMRAAPGSMAADRAADRWLQLAWLDDDIARHAARVAATEHVGRQSRVRARRCLGAAVRRRSAASCLQDPKVDALLAILTPFALTDADQFATELIDGGARAAQARVHLLDGRRRP